MELNGKKLERKYFIVAAIVAVLILVAYGFFPRTVAVIGLFVLVLAPFFVFYRYSQSGKDWSLKHEIAEVCFACQDDISALRNDELPALEPKEVQEVVLEKLDSLWDNLDYVAHLVGHERFGFIRLGTARLNSKKKEE